jgi:plastocyanin
MHLLRSRRSLSDAEFAVGAGHGTTDWLVKKYDAEQDAYIRRRLSASASGFRGTFDQAASFLKVTPYAVGYTAGNVITNAGWQALLASATAGGAVMFTSSKGRVGVGDTAGTPAATDTDLAATAGSTHRLFKFSAAAPTVSSGTTRTWTFVSTFQASDFNEAWNEFGIDQGTSDGVTVTAVFLNHANSAQGTKTSGQVWTATATLSFT